MTDFDDKVNAVTDDDIKDMAVDTFEYLLKRSNNDLAAISTVLTAIVGGVVGQLVVEDRSKYMALFIQAVIDFSAAADVKERQWNKAKQDEESAKSTH